MATLPDPAQNAATEPLRRFARDLLNRRPGDGAHLHWARVGGHEVWRVRQIATRWSVIVKCGADTATAREMAHSGVAPRVLAAEDASGVCVMEDVGDTTLADGLAATDADTASQGLQGLADALGRSHGWASAAAPTLGHLPVMPPLHLAAFTNICGALGVDASPAPSELVEAERCMRSEDPQVVLHEDVCPDNYVPGAGTRITGKFIDFEAARRGNAMLDAACWHMPFPTCWRVARLPVELPPRMDATYVAGFARRAQAPDTATFQRLMAAACVWWLVWCLTSKRFVETEDDRFAGDGVASVRERGLLWLDSAFATITKEAEFKATGDLARELAERLRNRWGPLRDPPLYPAFMPRRRSMP